MMFTYKGLKLSELRRAGPQSVVADKAKKAILKALQDPEIGVNLGAKAAPLADFVATLGDRMQTLASRVVITEGFLRAGQFESVSKPYPTVDSAIDTLQAGHTGMSKDAGVQMFW